MTARHQRTVQTLIEALPYIRRFQGATMVVKYGGAAMTSPQLAEQFAKDVVLLKLVGMRPVIVHGGGKRITAWLERLGVPTRFEAGLRVTDAAALEVAINKARARAAAMGPKYSTTVDGWIKKAGGDPAKLDKIIEKVNADASANANA